MLENKSKLVIYIIVTAVVTSLLLLFYRQVFLLPKLNRVEQLSSRIAEVEEKEQYYLQARLAIMSINSVDVRNDNYFEILSENLELLDNSVKVLDTLVLTDSERNLLDGIKRTHDDLEIELIEKGTTLAFEPSSELKLPSNDKQIDDFLYNLSASYTLFSMDDFEQEYLTDLEQQASLLERQTPLTNFQVVFDSAAYKSNYEKYLSMLYQLKEVKHKELTAELKSDTFVGFLVDLTNLLQKYQSEIDILNNEKTLLLESL